MKNLYGALAIACLITNVTFCTTEPINPVSIEVVEGVVCVKHVAPQPEVSNCTQTEKICSSCEMHQILALLPAELAKNLKNDDFNSQALLAAFYCTNQSLTPEQRVACGSCCNDTKWAEAVEYYAQGLLHEEQDPSKKAEIIEQTVAALHAYREQTAPHVVVEEVQNIPMDENNPYERED